MGVYQQSRHAKYDDYVFIFEIWFLFIIDWPF